MVTPAWYILNGAGRGAPGRAYIPLERRDESEADVPEGGRTRATGFVFWLSPPSLFPPLPSWGSWGALLEEKTGKNGQPLARPDGKRGTGLAVPKGSRSRRWAPAATATAKCRTNPGRQVAQQARNVRAAEVNESQRIVD